MDGKHDDISGLDKSLLLQHLILSNSFVRRGDSTLDFGLVKDKASVSEA